MVTASCDEIQKKVVMVSVQDINVDPAYQRMVSSSLIRRIEKQYNPVLAGAIVVAKRKDGTLWVVDGQHRLEAQKRRGQEKIACFLFASEGPEHEARVFYQLNTERRGMNCIDIYKAMLAHREPDTVAIENLLRSNGFCIGKSAGKFGGANAIRQAYEANCLGRLLYVISRSWGSGAERWKWMFGSSHFIQMLTHIYTHWGDSVDDERMIHVLNNMSHQEYQRLAAAHAGTTGNRAPRIAPEFIRTHYNNKLRKNRINLD